MTAGCALARLHKALADHGSPVRGTSARCPAHDDRNASLSVDQGEQGAVLHCHAGCAADEVLEALGMSAADLFDERRQRGSRSFEVVATYCYSDEHGEPLFYVERRQPKDFRQYRVVGGAKAWGIGGARRVPYHLPQLLAGIAAKSIIYVVEGEKDVHAVEAVGGVATCSPMGAGKWRPEYARWFENAAWVIIVADRDDKGREHARQVATSLRPVTGGVEIVEAVHGKDAADHLAAGHGLDRFRPAEPEPGAREWWRQAYRAGWRAAMRSARAGSGQQ